MITKEDRQAIDDMAKAVAPAVKRAIDKATGTNIRIDDEVYAAIMAAKGKLEAKTGKPQSLNAALRSALGLR